MTGQEQSSDGLLLSGLDGSNPLAFLAALGTLRGLTIALPGRRFRLSWKLRDTWRPCLYVGDGVLDEKEVLDGLESFIEMRPGHEALEIADNLPIPLGDFRRHACSAAKIAFTCPDKRAEGDFIAAFGSDVFADRQGRVQDTALRAVGTGQTRFIKTMRDLAEKVGRDKLQQCLFSQWERQDPRLSLRWDPDDDRRYALRSKAPTSEVTQTEWGANRLAYEALPLFPVMPIGRSARTTGFSGSNRRDTFWTWPIWDVPADLDTVRSLLALRKLQESSPDRQELAAMGIKQVFRAQRITTGAPPNEYRNFTPSTPV